MNTRAPLYTVVLALLVAVTSFWACESADEQTRDRGKMEQEAERAGMEGGSFEGTLDKRHRGGPDDESEGDRPADESTDETSEEFAQTAGPDGPAPAGERENSSEQGQERAQLQLDVGGDESTRDAGMGQATGDGGTGEMHDTGDAGDTGDTGDVGDVDQQRDADMVPDGDVEEDTGIVIERPLETDTGPGAISPDVRTRGDEEDTSTGIERFETEPLDEEQEY